jgi:hypothetical protein
MNNNTVDAEENITASSIVCSEEMKKGEALNDLVKKKKAFLNDEPNVFSSDKDLDDFVQLLVSIICEDKTQKTFEDEELLRKIKKYNENKSKIPNELNFEANDDVFETNDEKSKEELSAYLLQIPSGSEDNNNINKNNNKKNNIKLKYNNNKNIFDDDDSEFSFDESENENDKTQIVEYNKKNKLKKNKNIISDEESDNTTKNDENVVRRRSVRLNKNNEKNLISKNHINNKSESIDLLSDTPPPKKQKSKIDQYPHIHNFREYFGIVNTEFDTPLLIGLLNKFTSKFRTRRNGANVYHKLSFLNLLTLKKHQWLNGSVICAYFHYLNESAQETQKKSIFFMPKEFADTINNDYSYEKGAKYFECENIFDYERILIMFFKPPCHFTLMSVDLLQNIITYHDSIYKDIDSYREKAVNYVSGQINYLHEMKKDGITRQFTFIFDKTTPQQANGYDCGIFVCMFAIDYWMHNKIKESRQENCNYFRLYLLFTFIVEHNKTPDAESHEESHENSKVDINCFDKGAALVYKNLISEKINNVNEFIEDNCDKLFFESLHVIPSESLLVSDSNKVDVTSTSSLLVEYSNTSDVQTTTTLILNASATNKDYESMTIAEKITYVKTFNIVLSVPQAVQLFMNAEIIAADIVNNASHFVQQSVLKEFKDTFDYEMSNNIGFFNYFEKHYKFLINMIILEVEKFSKKEPKIKSKIKNIEKKNNTIVTSTDWRSKTIVEENGTSKVVKKSAAQENYDRKRNCKRHLNLIVDTIFENLRTMITLDHTLLDDDINIVENLKNLKIMRNLDLSDELKDFYAQTYQNIKTNFCENEMKMMLWYLIYEDNNKNKFAKPVAEVEKLVKNMSLNEMEDAYSKKRKSPRNLDATVGKFKNMQLTNTHQKTKNLKRKATDNEEQNISNTKKNINAG